jgi:hypothetical protein
MHELDIPPTAASVAAYYGDVINGFAHDQTDGDLPLKNVNSAPFQTVMRTDRDKIKLAEQLLSWIENGRLT